MDETRRYRGLVRTSLTAGGAFATIATGALVIGIATGFVPAGIFGIRVVVGVAARAFGAGALAGGLFSWMVARSERGRTLATLSTKRVALWGGLATASIPLLTTLALGPVIPIGIIATSALVAGIGGGIVSAGMLRMARRARQQQQEADVTPDHLLP